MGDGGGEGETRPRPVAREGAPFVWELQPVLPPKPPGRFEHFEARRPFVAQQVVGVAWVAVWVVFGLVLGSSSPWWSWVGLVVLMTLLLPLVNIWVWRQGGRRRRRYDARVRGSGGGAARLGG